MEFKLLNFNPTDRKKSDCVVRAICGATNQSWEKVYKDLCAIGLERYEMPNVKEVYEAYLKQLGWEKQKMPKEGRFRVQLSNFINKNPKGVFIVSVARHLTYFENGTLVDLWNCGGKCVGNYWIKK